LIRLAGRSSSNVVTSLRARFVAAVIAIGLLLSLRTAAAAPTARLVYVRAAGAETCPDEDSLKQSVAAHLGYDPFRPFVQNTLFAEIHRERGRFVGSVKLVDEAGIERGARKLESEASDCSDLTRAMALSISIAIDPRSVLRPQAPATDGASSTHDAADAGGTTNESASETPSASVPSTSPPPPASPTPRTQTVPSANAAAARFGVGLGAHGSLGLGVEPSAGLHLMGDVSTRSASVGLELRGDLPTSKTVSVAGTTSGASVRTWFLGGAVVPCGRLSFVSLCAVALVGSVRADTVGVAAPRNERFSFAAAGLRVGVEIPIDRSGSVTSPVTTPVTTWAVRIAAEGLGTITPYVLQVNGTQLYESPVVSGTLGATLVYFF
jgi:hypothetical protein